MPRLPLWVLAFSAWGFDGLVECADVTLGNVANGRIKLLFPLAGKGLKVRTRLYRTSPQQQSVASADCSVQLMEKSDCEGGVRRECQFDREDARVICGLKKEVGAKLPFHSIHRVTPFLGG